jgi:MSHA pilin protein MshC
MIDILMRLPVLRCGRIVDQSRTPATSSGFTLIELILVLTLTGILAVAVAPKFYDRTTFDSRGFYDEAIAALRYAQKTAIAHRRTVCVAFTSTTVSLSVAQAADATECDVALAGPTTGAAQYIVSARSGVNFTAVPANFAFNARGQASIGGSSQSMQISGAAKTITVDKETGYVR